MSYLIDIVATIFRPAVAGLAIAVALAAVTLDTDNHSISQSQLDITDLSCSGLFKPLCRAFAD